VARMKPVPRRPADSTPDSLRDLLPDVVPLPPSNRIQAPVSRPAPVAAQRLRDDREVLNESLSDHDAWEAGYETGDELVFLRPGLASNTLRKLRRGHWLIQRELDLHGLTVAEARPALVSFLNACLLEATRCVRIIHGKGLGSQNREPVLKRKVASWLMQRDEILAFCQARRTEGGGGAVVVLLKGVKR
jgi:DNA-nicking Smr family endonuclease